MSLKTRLLNLEWDNSKLTRLEYSERMRKRVAEGVHFSTGVIALSNGVVFMSMGEMESHLKAYGAVTITYQDEHVPTGKQA